MRDFKQKRTIKAFVVIVLILLFLILDTKYFLIENSFEYLFRHTDFIEVPEKYDSSNSHLYMYTFDVGQSESILLLYNNKSILIDSGTTDNAYPLVQTLKDLGLSKIDYLVFTHPHYDHMGSSSAIIRNFEPNHIYLTHYDYKSLHKWWYSFYEKAVLVKNMSPEFLEKERKITIDDLCLKVITPTRQKNDSLNNYSLSFKVSLNEVDILLLADIEVPIENDLLTSNENLEVEIIKVAHHGSSTSSSLDFLQATNAKYAIISVGENNPYGHPTDTVLENLNAIQAQVFRTDENGTILVKTDGEKIEILTTK